jgi:hypothetical protein
MCHHTCLELVLLLNEYLVWVVESEIFKLKDRFRSHYELSKWECHQTFSELKFPQHQDNDNDNNNTYFIGFLKIKFGNISKPLYLAHYLGVF